ncbi:hypothetical protein AB0L40_13055, partial [Patulibacter sp. NPDC049589]
MVAPTSLADARDVAAALGAAAPVGAEPVALDLAVGRIAAEDVVATTALPSFASSAMDGWAVRAADVGEYALGSPSVGPWYSSSEY